MGTVIDTVHAIPHSVAWKKERGLLEPFILCINVELSCPSSTDGRYRLEPLDEEVIIQ